MLDGTSASTAGDLVAADSPNIVHWLDLGRLAAYNSDPSTMVNSMASASPNLQQHAPGIAVGAQQTASRAVQYLQQFAPKNAVPPSGLPGDAEHKPSTSEMETFKQRASVLERPISLLEKGRAGTLLPLHVDAVATVFPKLYQKMVDETQQGITERRDPIPYRQKLMLSTLLRAPVGYTQQVLSPMFQSMPSASPAAPAQSPMKRSSRVVGHKLGFASATSTGLASADKLGGR